MTTRKEPRSLEAEIILQPSGVYELLPAVAQRFCKKNTHGQPQSGLSDSKTNNCISEIPHALDIPIAARSGLEQAGEPIQLIDNVHKLRDVFLY